MIWIGSDYHRWRRRFAVIPVIVGGTFKNPLYCWFEWYEWRWTEKVLPGPFMAFERRPIGIRQPIEPYESSTMFFPF